MNINTLKRTQTSTSSSLSYPSAKAILTFPTTPSLPSALPPNSRCTKFSFSPGSKFDSFLHFHIQYDEYLYVEKGTINVVLWNQVEKKWDERVITGGEEEIRIEKWRPHRWYLDINDAEVVVWERTEPADGEKELFFRNLMSLIGDYEGKPPFLQVFKIFADFDNYPIPQVDLALYFRRVIVALTGAIGRVAGLSGYKSKYEEYTPVGKSKND